MTDIPANGTTTAHLAIGDSFVGTIESGGDHDWIAVNLVAGEKYTFTLDGYGSNALEDPYLYLRNSAGTVLVENDDGDGNRNSRIVFTATKTGTYYLDASAWDDATGSYKYTGDYKLTADHFTAPPVYTYNQIADQLVNGYWGGDWHHFNVTQGGTLTVNVTALTTAGQTLARAALQEWSDVIGVHFKEVATGGQIVFDDNQDGAFTTSDWSNHVISTSNVNVSTQWLTDYGTTLYSYAFQSYVHEIGHALGLGHGGNYNDTANYPDDALYANDAWSTTVMSYFSQHDSSYFANQGFSEDFALTPMSADIIAMQTLYGLSTTTRTGDTIYGYGSTAKNAVYDTAANPLAAYTIIDSGGIDTLNYSKASANQLINLNPLTFSNVAGSTGNVSIAVGTVIENATSGGGNDTIVGNSANNVLDGGAGKDTVSYDAATAGVTVNLTVATAQNTRSAGTDTLKNFENLTGSQFDDILTGKGGGIVHGGGGNDVIHGSTGGDHLYGDDGDDTFIPGSGTDTINGGAGWDTIDFSSLRTAVVADLATTYTSVEEEIGTHFSDTLNGSDAANTLEGLAGDDTLYGNGGNDTLDGGAGTDQMYGGTGNDIYRVRDVTDYVHENAGEGSDRVISWIDYTLGANVENLTLMGTAGLSGEGNALSNVLNGNSGSNMLSGDDGNDKLYGFDGNDTLQGGAGKDTLVGGKGDDTYYADSYGDRAIENPGEGTDSIFSTADYKLRDNIENITLTGSANLWAYGNDGTNVITGNDGANKLYGMGGSDTITGGDGNDFIQGGAGQDVVIGGAGKDSFVFRDGDFGGATAGSADRIIDFIQGDDHIRLDYVDADTTIAGNQAFAFMGTAAFDNHAGELRYEEISGNTYVSGDTNGDGVADFMIRLDGLHALTSHDFVL
ncbi:M10 family metallopeptidase C-terminal domain-containing protein [Sphingomonas sp.]|uniref:M10 family metallopeptidase C-terminal domain-containing protein n=1 Tax=Sphingomonas sp. TaxID=28214 RepID=UPI0025F750BC|nr:M10 family metallopeptidase C-terminal domain-containing protein [Sphingomonas sp.]MBV9528974.1 M10 family metallopeptidase C-terminal domain-containing protein [Sphingomonas sp.]